MLRLHTSIANEELVHFILKLAAGILFTQLRDRRLSHAPETVSGLTTPVRLCFLVRKKYTPSLLFCLYMNLPADLSESLHLRIDSLFRKIS